MKQKLGKVSISPKGEWSSTTAYECLDTVNFGGGSWLAKRANTAVSPVEGDDWMQLSAKGADAEVTKDSIVEALGYEPQEAEGTYELIETITLKEATAIIERTQTQSGEAYNFASMLVLISYNGNNVSSTYFGVGGDSLNKAVGANTPHQVFRGVIRPLYGTWDVFGYYGGAGSASYSVGQAAVNYIATKKDFASIGFLRIYGIEKPVGTTIKIYAVRA